MVYGQGQGHLEAAVRQPECCQAHNRLHQGEPTKSIDDQIVSQSFHSMSYMQDATDPIILMSIVLSPGTRVYYARTRPDGSPSAFAFAIKTPDHPLLYLCAESEEDQKSW